MLTQISVQGFKSLESVRDLALGQVNVFVGANGSGKSNLLEAVGLLGAAAGGQIDDQALLRRGVRPGTPVLYKSSFGQTEANQGIKIVAAYELESDVAGFEIEINNGIDEQRQHWVYQSKWKLNGKELTPESTKADPTLHEDFPLDFSKEWERPVTLPFPKFLELPVFEKLLSMLHNYAIFAPYTPVLRGVVPDITQRQPIGLSGGQLAGAVDDLLDTKGGLFGSLDLEELLELLDWVDDIAIEPPSRDIVSPSVPTLRSIIRFTDRWMAGGHNQLSAYDASEGALYVLFALVLALHPKSPRLFAVENLDQAMHPRLARATMRLFCDQVLQAEPARQVLLTTHNPLVLDGLDLRDDHIRLFTVERNERGATCIKRVQVSEKILQKIQDGLALSNLWVQGFLGGVPDIF